MIEICTIVETLFTFTCSSLLIQQIKNENGSNYLILGANENNFTWERCLSQTFIHPEYHKIMTNVLLGVVITGQNSKLL